MCLITSKRKVKIAKRDIPVWKLLKPDLSTVYQPFKYERGKDYETEIKFLDNDDEWQPFDGNVRKSLNERFPDWEFSGDSVREEMLCITEGFHAFVQKKKAINKLDFGTMARYCGAIEVKFIIPKGAEYYKDFTGQIVSNKIKVA